MIWTQYNNGSAVFRSGGNSEIPRIVTRLTEDRYFERARRERNPVVEHLVETIVSISAPLTRAQVESLIARTVKAILAGNVAHGGEPHDDLLRVYHCSRDLGDRYLELVETTVIVSAPLTRAQVESLIALTVEAIMAVNVAQGGDPHDDLLRAYRATEMPEVRR